MEDILLICVVALFFVIGYFWIKKEDQTIEYISKPQKILIIYDQNYSCMKDYKSDEILCIEKREMNSFSYPFSLIILCTIDDYYHLIMNYHIRRDIQECQVYAICHNRQYLNLYENEHIHVLQTLEDIKELMAKVYD